MTFRTSRQACQRMLTATTAVKRRSHPPRHGGSQPERSQLLLGLGHVGLVRAKGETLGGLIRNDGAR